MEKAEEFTPRDYQVDLYEKAIESNSIIYLPTGAGKTYIALMVIKKLSVHIRRPWAEGGKRTIFAVNNVPLVNQQRDYINRHTDLKCSGYSGDLNVDFWEKSKWLEELTENQVLVMTAQIALNLLNHGYLQLSNINLIIFDECHHAVNDHPMRQIMKIFENYDKRDHPHILGLSATLLNSNVKSENVLVPIRDLELTLHAKVISIDSLAAVSGYGTPCEQVVNFDPVNNPFITELEEIIRAIELTLSAINLPESVYLESSEVFQPTKKVNKLKNIFGNIRMQIETQGIYAGYFSVLHHLVQLESLKKTSRDLESLTLFDFLKTQMVRIMIKIKKIMNEPTEMGNLKKYSSDKVIKLLNTIKNTYYKPQNDNNEFRCIIFVERRFTSKVICHLLKKFAEIHDDGKFLKPDYVLGNNSNPYNSPIENMCLNKWNNDALRKFRSGTVNCLVSTKVLEEGVDIPECGMVINYDPPLDFRSYIQARGRARHKDSSVIMFIEKGNELFNKRYQEYQKIESNLKNYLIGDTCKRTEPLPMDIEVSLYTHEIKPYSVVSDTGVISQITEVSAISVINKYCSKLGQSRYVNAVPVYKLFHIPDQSSKENSQKKYLVSLRLPILSALRDTIHGDVMLSITSAKRSAAMKVCKKLHEMGELTNYLLPREVEDVAHDITVRLKYWRDELPENKKKVGGTNNKHLYSLIHPSSLYSAFPQPNEDIYLHVIQIKPTYPVPTENRDRVFYNLLNNNGGFAMLTSKKMPRLPQFNIYMHMGEINVKPLVNYKIVKLSSCEIQELKQFHKLLFCEVLEVVKPFMTFDVENKQNCYLVIPIDNKSDINWDAIRRYALQEKLLIENDSQKAITDGNSIASTLDFYNDWELVLQSYRTSDIYAVTKVCTELSPMSTFPTDDYLSYLHYFAEKHHLHISNTCQPLLEVKPISKKINYIRKCAPKSSTKRKRENLEEHLIPELCSRILFSSLYWLKSMLLPSILHRINQLLIAEDLRQQIVREAGLGTISSTIFSTPDNNSNWKTLCLSSVNELPSDSESTSDNEDIAESIQLYDLPTDDESDSIAKNDTKDIPECEIDISTLNDTKYPWLPEKEPCDLERNADQIRLLDIEYYYFFINEARTEFPNHNYVEYSKSPVIQRPLIKAPILSALNKKLSNEPTAADILPAITAKFAHDSLNLERLETLGDSFLKFITSLYLFHTYPYESEGHLTIWKGRIIGNRHLYYCGIEKKIPQRTKVDDFEPASNFIVPSFSVPSEIQELITKQNKSPNVLYEITIPVSEQSNGQLSNETRQQCAEIISGWVEATNTTGVEQFIDLQMVPDKTVADVVESLTGVYLNGMGFLGAAKLLQWFGVLPDDAKFNEILYGSPKTARIIDGNITVHMPWADSIQRIIGYKFNDLSYLLQAFTHASYSENQVTQSYDRLEFLGDAVIDVLITIYIFESCGNLSPGELTDLRSALVNNTTFACLAIKYKLHTALLSYTPIIATNIEKFAKFQEERNHVINDELLWILLEEEDCNIVESVDVPKVLGDIFESLIGAIYEDSGRDIKKVWEILYSFMHNEIKQFSKNVPKQAIRVLYETPGLNPKFSKHEILEGSGRIKVTLVAQISGKKTHFHGFGATAKQAKTAAAKRALKFVRQPM